MIIDHIGIAVRSIEESSKIYRLLGLEVSHVEVVESQGVKTAFLKLGESNIELLEPIDENSPVFKFLEKRGEGIHHIALSVENIGEKLKELKNNGVKLINNEPVKGAHGKLVAFVHPKSAGGVLLELCEKIK